MDSSRRKTDQAFERKLRERFEDFQAPEKEGLSEKIFETIGVKPRRRRWLAVVLVALLLLLGLLVGNHLNDKSDLGRRKAVLEKAKSGNSNAADHTADNQTRKENPAHHFSTNSYKPNLGANAVSPIPKTRIPQATVRVADSSVTTNSSHADLNVDLLSKRDLHFGQFNVELLSARDLHFGQLTLPEIAFKDSSRTNEEQAVSKSSPFIPVFSITGMQQFQIVNVHSDSEMPFQNVRFAPLLSARSISYKVSAGIQKGGLQLLLTYGNMRTWNYYEVGTNRIEISPTNGDQYIQHRGGTPRIIDEKVHLLGLSARTKLPLGRTPFRGLSTMAGLDFTTVLPDPAMMLWANIRSLKVIQLGKKTSLAIGPYAEYSLSQRRFLSGRWQSRPYRIGLTVEIR